MVSTTSQLVLEGGGRLHGTVVLSWSSDVNASGSRLVASAEGGAVSSVGRITFLPGSELDLGSTVVDVHTCDTQSTSLVQVNGPLQPERSPRMAHAIVELLKMHNVESLVLVAALNLADQAGNDPVLYASMHAKNSAILKGKPALNASTPLNDPFLGALVPLLNLTPSIQTILIAAPAKRERTIETGVLLPGVSESDVDTALPFLATALSEMTGIAFSGDVARNVLLPHIQAVRDVEGTAKVADKKDDLLLMYM